MADPRFSQTLTYVREHNADGALGIVVNKPTEATLSVAAGKKAFLDAIEKARPIVLEPIVSVEIICPETNTGDIAGDLSSRRGRVTSTRGLQPGILAITGLAPLAELEGYSARLKSVTGGHGSWSMQLSHCEQAPPNLQQQLVTEYKKSRRPGAE